MEKSCDQTLVWVDTDITIGRKNDLFSYCDVDDGFALAALFRSEQVEVVGISSTLGNTSDIDVSTATAKEFVAGYGPNSAPVFQGCRDAKPAFVSDMETNEAVEALAATLRQDHITLLCIGAATNVAILLSRYPELQQQIDEVVLVAGRRSMESHFISGKWQPKPFRDLNFDFNPEAFQVIFESNIDITLVPFEACKHFWIKPHDLVRIGEANRVGKFLALHSLGWIAEWEAVFGANGFNPFDLVAAGYLIRPDLFDVKQWKSQVQIGADDTRRGKSKPYLICNESLDEGRIVNYCVAAAPECKAYLLDRICTHDMAAYVLGLSHVNVIVPSVDEATEFYHRVLGFEQAYDHNGQKMDYVNVEMKSFAIDAGIKDGVVNVDVRFLKHPQASIYLELMTYHKPKGNQELPRQAKTYDVGGPRHIALEVSNCMEVFNYLKDQGGVTMINPDSDYHPVKLDGFPITFFYWVDKYGVQWEMEEGRRVGTLRGIV